MRHADVQTLFTLSTYQGNDYLALLEREETFDSDGYDHTGDAGYFNSGGVLSRWS